MMADTAEMVRIFETAAEIPKELPEVRVGYCEDLGERDLEVVDFPGSGIVLQTNELQTRYALPREIRVTLYVVSQRQRFLPSVQSSKRCSCAAGHLIWCVSHRAGCFRSKERADRAFSESIRASLITRLVGDPAGRIDVEASAGQLVDDVSVRARRRPFRVQKAARVDYQGSH